MPVIALCPHLRIRVLRQQEIDEWGTDTIDGRDLLSQAWAKVGKSGREASSISNPVCDRDHFSLRSRGQYAGSNPSVLQVTCIVVGGSAMWDDLDSYRELLSEHASDRHLLGSSLLVLVVVGTLLIVFG
jgi:hypothetical protein